MYYRVEIIRLSDKSFKETIKEVEMTSARQTSKEGYLSLDPSKPLPHEYEEGKLSRYNDNNRPKHTAAGSDQSATGVAKTLYATSPNGSFQLNKTELREILMNVLNNAIMDDPSFDSPTMQLIGASSTKKVPQSNGDDTTYPNQTIENNINSDSKGSKTSLESPEVDKLLNGGEYDF